MYLFALKVCTWEWNIAKWKKNCIKRQAPWKSCVQEIMRKGPHPFAKLWLLCEKLNSTIVMCFHEIDNYLFVHSLLSIPFRQGGHLLWTTFASIVRWFAPLSARCSSEFHSTFSMERLLFVSFPKNCVIFSDKISCRCSFITLVITVIIIHFYFCVLQM